MNAYEEAARIHKMIEETLEPIRQIQDQYSEILEPIRQTQEILNNCWVPYQNLPRLTNENITQIINSVNAINQTFSAPLQQLSENLLCDLREAFSKINNITIHSHDMLNTFSNGVSFSPSGVSITEEALQAVSEFVDLPPETLNDCPENSETSIKTISLKEFFLGVLIPLLLMFVPMAQTQYLHSLDSLEADRQQLEESEYQERLLQIEEERLENERQLLTYLEQISESLEDLQSDQQILEESVTALQQSLTESLPIEGSADPENEAADALDTHNGYE